MFLKSVKKRKAQCRKSTESGSFYECIRIVLLVFRWIGFLPLNVEKCNPRYLSFTWLSVYNVLCYFPSIGFSLFFKVIQIYTYTRGITRPEILLFFSMIFIEILLILRLCQKFQIFIEDIEKLENGTPPITKYKAFMRFVRTYVILFVFLGIGEIMVTLIADIERTYNCHVVGNTDGFDMYLQVLIKTTTGGLFEVFPFSYTLAFIVEIHKFQARMTWYMCDVLIMTVCIYLNRRFQDFNRIVIQNEISMNKTFRLNWSELQVHYTRLTRIVTTVDEHINAIIFVSYAYNLYHFCVRLYYFLNQLTIRRYYYSEKYDCVEEGQNLLSNVSNAYMITFLVLRLAMVSHLAAELHNTSRKSLVVLHSVSTADYDCDMQRLMEQVYHSKVGVSGLRFFQITRSVLLAIIAKIMTYELVLIQFGVQDSRNITLYDSENYTKYTNITI